MTIIVNTLFNCLIVILISVCPLVSALQKRNLWVPCLFVYGEGFSLGLLNIWMLVIFLQMESLMWCCSKFKKDFLLNFLKNCEFQVSWTAWQLKLKWQLQRKCQLQQIWDRNRFHLTAVCEFYNFFWLEQFLLIISQYITCIFKSAPDKITLRGGVLFCIETPLTMCFVL